MVIGIEWEVMIIIILIAITVFIIGFCIDMKYEEETQNLKIELLKNYGYNIEQDLYNGKITAIYYTFGKDMIVKKNCGSVESVYEKHHKNVLHIINVGIGPHKKSKFNEYYDIESGYISPTSELAHKRMIDCTDLLEKKVNELKSKRGG